MRALIECPFECVKVKQIAGNSVKIENINFYKGFSSLYPRCVFLLTTYFTYVDCLRRHTNLMDTFSGQFLVSGSASLLAYALIWPFEVLKNVTQACDKNISVTLAKRVKHIYRKQGISGFYRGMLPGSSGIFIRNGFSMVVMQAFQK